MKPEPGYFYLLDDAYFQDFPSNWLLKNKTPTPGHWGLRPHICAFEDPKAPGIYWMVPISSKMQKYSVVAAQKQAKYGFCNTILFANVLGHVSPFLIQNMVPVSEKYIVDMYRDRNSDRPVRISEVNEKAICTSAKQVLKIYRRGEKLIFPDVDIIRTELQKQLGQIQLDPKETQHPKQKTFGSLDEKIQSAKQKSLQKPPVQQPFKAETKGPVAKLPAEAGKPLKESKPSSGRNVRKKESRKKRQAEKNNAKGNKTVSSYAERISRKQLDLAMKTFKEEMDESDLARKFYMDDFGNTLGWSITRADGNNLSFNPSIPPNGRFSGDPDFEAPELEWYNGVHTQAPYQFNPEGRIAPCPEFVTILEKGKQLRQERLDQRIAQAEQQKALHQAAPAREQGKGDKATSRHTLSDESKGR